jgi:hypothetical protein
MQPGITQTLVCPEAIMAAAAAVGITIVLPAPLGAVTALAALFE